MIATIADIRTSYSKKSLSKQDVLPNAIEQFGRWWNEALSAELTEVNAMTLATAYANGVPDARVVLLKGFSKEGFIFFTNYESAKGKALTENPQACLLFFWKELERQVRITGTVSKISKEDSEAYFFSRPVDSQIGALASNQSAVLNSRKQLEDKLGNLYTAITAGKKIEKPDYWGGYIVKPINIEFWQGRPSRLHDRLRYTLQPNTEWLIERLYP